MQGFPSINRRLVIHYVFFIREVSIAVTSTPASPMYNNLILCHSKVYLSIIKKYIVKHLALSYLKTLPKNGAKF